MGTAASVTKTTTMPSDGATVDAVDWSTKIGNAVQKITLDNLLGNMTMGFTQDERLENEKVEASQKSTGSFVIAHNFYGFPTKASKQNADPLSPLWIEVDIAKLEEIIDQQNDTTSSQQTVVFDRNLMSTVPSGVLIDKNGDIKIVFAKSGLSYDVTATDVARAVASAKSSNRQLLVPSPPYLEYAGANVLLLRWDLPFPPGITTKVEVQFIDATKFTPKGAEPLSKTDQENMGARDGFVVCTKKPREGDWQYASVRCYEVRSVDSFEYDHLRPGKSFYFRIRLWTHEGFSAFSEPSKIMSTLAGPPAQPVAPVVVVSMPTCMQLRWSPPLSNGAKISLYILRGKGVGDTEYRELYSGSLTSYLVMSLHPDSAYTFQVAAVNSIGTSEFSEMGSGTTVAVKSFNASPESAAMKSALECREAWTECWDPQSEQYFFFNSITGTRQLERPMVLRGRQAATTTSEEQGAEETTADDELKGEIDEKKEKEISFRRKRFRLITAVHRVGEQQKQKRPGNPSSAHGQGDGLAQREVYLAELRRSHLLIDGYRAIHKASIYQVYNRLKVEFTGEEGIDSGGLGKEAFLLLSKDSAMFAGPNYKNWLVLHNAAESSNSEAASGGLFFTEEEPKPKEAEKGKKVPPPPMGGPRGGAMGGPRGGGLQKQLSSARRSASSLLKGDFGAHQRQQSWQQVAPGGGSLGASSMISGQHRRNSGLGGVDESTESKGVAKQRQQPTSVDNSLSVLDKDEKVCRESFFRFLGRLVGKALYDRQLIDMPLAPILFKHMVGDVAEDDSPPPATPPSPHSPKPALRGGPSAAKPYGSPGVIPPPPRKPGPPINGKTTPVPVTSEKPGDASPATSTTSSASTSASEPAPAQLTEDDLADFPDELCEHARKLVKKRLLQALVDVRSLDSQLYKSLLWMVNNDITHVIDETFSVLSTSTGETVPLCKDGAGKDVTEDNKFEYVELMARWKTTYAVSGSLVPFLRGFHELVPMRQLNDASISAAELNLMLNGKPDIDVEELRPYVIFQGGPGWNEQTEVVLWLWQAMRDFDEESRRGFLKFFTGSSRIPLDGFDPALNITEGVDMVMDSLPKAHTCFNQLVIPLYSSYETLKEKILFAVANTEGFELS